VKFLRLLLALVLALVLQAALGRLWPGAHRYADIMIVPVVWCGIAGSQRSAMFLGCAAGLLQDTWFQLGAFGLNGFKKTALGWVLGGLGSRFDLNRQGVRMACGALASIADSLMDMVLRRLLDQRQPPPNPSEILIKAVVVGIMVAGLFSVMRVARSRRGQRYRR
jgi:cell shape-determining protein MreD